MTSVKEGYEGVINSLVENLLSSIESLSQEVKQLTTENQGYK